MAEKKEITATENELPAGGAQKGKQASRRPDCVTETRMGNTILVVSGFFKQDATDTAADKMMKVLKAEAAASCIVR